MHVVPIRSNFNEIDFEPLGNLQAYFLEFLINFSRKNDSSVLRRTDKMIHEDGHVVLFMDIGAHESILGKLQAAASCGELTQVIKLDGIGVKVISKSDLIKSKLAANRPKDLADVAELKRTK